MTKQKRNVPGLVVFHDSFLKDGDPLAEGVIPLVPPVDLYETEDCYVLNAELPGVETKDVHVQVRGSEITIWGERKMDAGCPDESYHRLEGIRGRFHRTFSLPVTMDENTRIHASLTDGILRVELDKSSKPRNIVVQPSRKGC